MSTALQIAAKAYEQANVGRELTTFTSTQYPYSIAKTLINDVIKQMNRPGRLYFLEASQTLPFVASQSSYDLAAYNINPQKIIRVWRNAGQKGKLTQINYDAFLESFRSGASVNTSVPSRYAKYGSRIYLDTEPDQDYELTVDYFKEMPEINDESDVLLVPERDEDVVQNGVYSLLLQRLGRPDFNSAFLLFQDSVKEMEVTVTSDSGIPQRLPRAF